MVGIAGGEDVVVIPEVENDRDAVAAALRDAYARGKRHAMVVVAEGAKWNATALANSPCVAARKLQSFANDIGLGNLAFPRFRLDVRDQRLRQAYVESFHEIQCITYLPLAQYAH